MYGKRKGRSQIKRPPQNSDLINTIAKVGRYKNQHIRISMFLCFNNEKFEKELLKKQSYYQKPLKIPRNKSNQRGKRPL